MGNTGVGSRVERRGCRGEEGGECAWDSMRLEREREGELSKNNAIAVRHQECDHGTTGIRRSAKCLSPPADVWRSPLLRSPSWAHSSSAWVCACAKGSNSPWPICALRHSTTYVAASSISCTVGRTSTPASRLSPFLYAGFTHARACTWYIPSEVCATAPSSFGNANAFLQHASSAT